MHLHLPYKCLLSYIIYYHALGCVCVDGWVTVVCVWFPMWYMCLSERGVHVWMWSTERLFSHREGLSCMYVVSGPFGRVHPPSMPLMSIFLWCAIKMIDVVTDSVQTTPTHYALLFSWKDGYIICVLLLCVCAWNYDVLYICCHTLGLWFKVWTIVLWLYISYFSFL